MGGVVHKLIHGYALEEMDKLIAQGVKVDAIITDPPFEITACKWDKIIPFDLMWERLKKLIKPRGAIVLCGAEPFSSALRMSNIEQYKYDWIWEKTQATGHLNANKRPLVCHENIVVFYGTQCFYTPQKTHGHSPMNTGVRKSSHENNCYGKINTCDMPFGGNTDRYPRSIIKFKSDKQVEYLHPTQKPLALMEYLIRTYTNEGEIVLDFTMGVGTTGLACKNTNRDFIGIEKVKEYFVLAQERIEKGYVSEKIEEPTIDVWDIVFNGGK